MGELSKGRFATVFVALLAGMFVSAIDQMVVTTLSLSIVRDLGAGPGDAGWLVTTYLLASTAAMPLSGKIADLYGRKATYLGAMGLFVAGSLGAVLSGNLAMLAVMRGIQGVGGGALVTATFAVLADLVPPRDRGKYQGGFGAVFASSALLGPVVGGFFADGHRMFGLVLDWHAVFALNIPLGLLAILVNAMSLPRSKRAARRSLDLIGAALLVAGVCALLLGAQRSSVWLDAGGVVVLGAFVWWELRAAEPILPMRLFRDRTFSGLNAGSLLLGLAVTGVLVYLTVYVQLAQGVTPTQAGLSLLPLSLGMVAASTVAGLLATKLGRFRPFVLVGAPIATLGMVLLSTLDVDTSIGTVRAYALLVGVGAGLMQQMFVLGVQNSARAEDLGVATASTTFFRTLGGSLGAAVFGAIFAGRTGGSTEPAVTVTAMTTVFLTAAALGAVIFVVTFLVPDRPLRELDQESLALAELGLGAE